MTESLAGALRETLGGWQADLPVAWRALLDEVELGFDACDPDLMIEPWEPIFPARLGRTFPGAPKGAHIFRSFDGIEPDDVRCVILGQDPYPAPDFATGRAFEAGNVAEWRELDKMFSKSVRAYMQLICAARTGRADYARSFQDWPSLLADIEQGSIDLQPADQLASHWIGQGALLLNSSFTLSRFKVETDPHQSRGHLPVWRPLILKVLEAMAGSGRPMVFMAFGDVAMDCLKMAGLEISTGNCHTIQRPHPAEADAMLALENPFLACNRFFASVGAKPIAW